jgi:hypothetical protein
MIEVDRRFSSYETVSAVYATAPKFRRNSLATRARKIVGKI